MSCALPNPVSGVCANKRPVQGRRVGTPSPVEQAALTPLAEGHEMPRSPVPTADVAAATPFSADAPEATFSMSQLRVVESSEHVIRAEAPAQVTASSRPSFREIRAGRAAASSRAPVAEVRIPIDELESGTLVADAARHASTAPAPAPVPAGMDQLVERVRQRTAARMSRSGTFSPV
jgi:hypothetical protein